LQHFFFFDGNEKRIAWQIETNNKKIEQKREHADIYLDQVSKLQSKIIALHVGLFWGIGRFIIKNEDEIIVMIDDESIFAFLSKKKSPKDDFLKTRIHFINQLIIQRKLRINLKLIRVEENFVSKLIESNGS